MTKLTNDIELAPLRSLDDFLLGSARFQIPPYKDLNKWANRMISNFLYYQTNYIFIILVVFVLISLIHPRDMVFGFLVVLIGCSVLLYSTSKNPDVVVFKKEHPLVSLVFIAIAGYFVVYFISSVVTFLFGIALPLLVIFIHAALRLRNFANKVTNRMEAMGLKKTLMSHLFDILGFDIEYKNQRLILKSLKLRTPM